MTTHLDLIVQGYLNENLYQHEYREVTKSRDQSIPFYKQTIEQFIAGRLNLASLYAKLTSLNKDKFWKANGSGFLMEIRKFDSNHAPTNPEFEAAIRLILDGLNAENVGRRIEQLYILMSQEEERLLMLGMHQSLCASPKNSAFLVSLIALWLDHTHGPYVYYRELRQGLAALTKAHILSAPTDLRFDANGIVISSEIDHFLVKRLLDRLAFELPPEVKGSTYWAEYFLAWISNQTLGNPHLFKDQELAAQQDSEIRLQQALRLPSGEATEENTTVETAPAGEIETRAPFTFEDDALPALPEEALTSAIAELRRRMLVDEALIRRIYHALLNGHVILTGPPGTGKTELARLIPELLWHDSDQECSAYTTTLVTATSDWNPRTLISSIVPIVQDRQVAFETQYGHLTQAIMKNWFVTLQTYPYVQRTKIQSVSFAHEGVTREFHGHWLVIDEFNRGPIDSALGEALTALSNGGTLQVPINGLPGSLPLPQDFRIIGTLNSFDRHYLNQISEALKRRFSFIEIPPPSRLYRAYEQSIVLYKALVRCKRFSTGITHDDSGITWQNIVFVGSDTTGLYECIWEDTAHPFYRVFALVLWPLFEVVRVYRQLGTAQIISSVAQMLTTGILQNYTEETQWLEALDTALCDTVADQLQVLMPDELEVLLWYLKLDADTFILKYNETLPHRKPRRQMAHLEALSSIVDEHGQAYFTDEQMEYLLDPEQDVEPQIAPAVLTEIFHLNRVPFRLPQFTRRLRMLKAERGL